MDKIRLEGDRQTDRQTKGQTTDLVGSADGDVSVDSDEDSDPDGGGLGNERHWQIVDENELVECTENGVVAIETGVLDECRQEVQWEHRDHQQVVDYRQSLNTSIIVSTQTTHS